MSLTARILIARARAANRKAARQRYRRLCAELADYSTAAQRCDLAAALDRYPEGVAYEVRDILAEQGQAARRLPWSTITGPARPGRS